jgi:hypothetical protein
VQSGGEAKETVRTLELRAAESRPDGNSALLSDEVNTVVTDETADPAVDSEIEASGVTVEIAR